MKSEKKIENTISVNVFNRATTRLRMIGETPMYQNRMPAKVMQGLLVGTKKKTAVERLEIKHHPLDEFRSAAEIMPDGPTALGLKTTAIKASMATAALETAGVTKTSVHRLLFVPGERVALYGTPQIKLDVVRSADMNRTPDIRSRPYLPVWGAEVELRYITPQLTQNAVANLLFNAGVIVGVGDNRQEKGKSSNGLFRIIAEDDEDEEWNNLVKYHGRKAQEKALAHPECADQDTADLLAFWENEVARRRSEPTGGKSVMAKAKRPTGGKSVVAKAKRKTTNGKEGHI